ncbi:MAG: multicopper oxidase domain-containing protein [Mariprofundaceae bacterium]
MKRREFMKLTSASLCSFALASCGGGDNSHGMFDGDMLGDSNNSPPLNTESFTNAFAIPPELTGTMINSRKVFDLNVQPGQMNFTSDSITATLGINGHFLGPTLRVNRGDDVDINVNNYIGEPTTMHWHGMHVPGDMDGSPHQEIAPNQSWKASFPIQQRASTNWYHPHAENTTASQVYSGLAGMLIVDDEETAALDLPKRYGIDDIPVVIQDRDFNADGSLDYTLSHFDQMNGKKGNTFLINGVIDASLDVEAKEVRFRLLNGSNARVYRLAFSDGLTFKQIATEQSLLPEPITLNSVVMSPGERVEIIVDFSNFMGSGFTFDDQLSGKSLFQVNVTRAAEVESITPNSLTNLAVFSESQAVRSRSFELSMFMGSFLINGVSMNMDIINESVTFGDVEIWDIKNRSNMIHNFHVHGAYFTLLSRDGSTPGTHERGYKDTVYLPANSHVQVIIQFADYKAGVAAPYMYHCHILEHEVEGMMGQLIVV